MAHAQAHAEDLPAGECKSPLATTRCRIRHQQVDAHNGVAAHLGQLFERMARRSTPRLSLGSGRIRLPRAAGGRRRQPSAGPGARPVASASRRDRSMLRVPASPSRRAATGTLPRLLVAAIAPHCGTRTVECMPAALTAKKQSDLRVAAARGSVAGRPDAEVIGSTADDRAQPTRQALWIPTPKKHSER